MRSTGKNEMTILKTCVKCRKILTTLCITSPPGSRLISTTPWHWNSLSIASSSLQHTQLGSMGSNLCLLVLRPRWFMVLQGSRIMRAPRRKKFLGEHQKYSEALHLFAHMAADIERLYLWCGTLYSSSQAAQRWFGSGSFWKTVTPGLSVWQ